MRDRRRRRGGALVLLVTIGLAAAGCGSNDNGGAIQPSASSTTAAAATLFNDLPPEIQSAKQIKVGSDVSYPPVEFFKEGTQEAQGLDVDLANALGAKLGVQFVFQNSTFEGIIAGLTAKRFDVVMSAMSDTAKRRDQGVDFVDYLTAGTSIIVQKGNPKGIKSPDDFCGQTVGIQKGTTQEDVARAQADKCQKDGKGTVTIQTFDKDPEALQQLKLGHIAADMNDAAVAAFAVQQSPNDYEVVGAQIAAGPYGVAVRKDDTRLRDAIHAALQAIIDDGTYGRVLAKWNVAQAAVKSAQINAGP